MPGPYHDFLLLADSSDRAKQCALHYHDPAAVVIDDDLVHYMSDSLRWVPSENPATEDTPGDGVNLYGVTAFSGDGARQLARVLNAWSVRFRCGPEILQFTGTYATVDGEGGYECLERRRDDVIETLGRIASMAEEAIAPGYWLLHLGI